MWAKFWHLIFALDVLLVNLALFLFLFRPSILLPQAATAPTTPTPALVYTPIPSLPPLPTVLPLPSSTTIPTRQPVSSTVTSYITVPGSGQLLSYTWTDLPGTEFYFDESEFPDLIRAYFEANMKLLNGNGRAFLRLFDVTHGVEIWGSEITTTSQQNTVVVSTPLTFRPGRNLIRVQAKSLTADTTVFTSGRLKLVSQIR